MYRGFRGNRLFHDGGRYHTENSANQWTGFYMITASVMKELKSMNPISRYAISFVNHPKQLYVPLTEVKILGKKSELSDMKKERLTKIGLPETVKLFVRSNLSPHDEETCFNCRELRRKGHIHNIWFYSGSVLSVLIKKYLSLL